MSSTNVSSGYDFLLRGRPARKSTPPADFLSVSDENSLDLPTPGMHTPPHHAAERTATPPTPTYLEPVRDQAAINASEHGRYLGTKLEFIVPQQVPEYPDVEANGRARTLFVGQLRFETTAHELRYLVELLTGVKTLKAEVRGAGCFVLYVSSELDETMVRALNRRLLFDHNGVWYARTADATEALLDFVEKTLPNLKGSKRRTLRLPRDCIVIEDSRTRKNVQSSRGSPHQPPRSPYNSMYGQQPPQMLQQQLQQQHPSHGHHQSMGAGYYNAPSPYGYSEPTTPHYAHSPGGFHGQSLPDYVYSGNEAPSALAMPPPPPYTASSSSWHC